MTFASGLAPAFRHFQVSGSFFSSRFWVSYLILWVDPGIGFGFRVSGVLNVAHDRFPFRRACCLSRQIFRIRVQNLSWASGFMFEFRGFSDMGFVFRVSGYWVSGSRQFSLQGSNF